MTDASSLPSGIIVMWSGASTAIPTGWLLCNGTNNTPDLRDRFIVGAGSSYSVGSTGGESTHTLTVDEMPSHNHEINLNALQTSLSGDHGHVIKFNPFDNSVPYSAGYGILYGGTSSGVVAGWQANDSNRMVAASAGSHTHTISDSASITDTGSGSAHENRPPYYALCFIMKQ